MEEMYLSLNKKRPDSLDEIIVTNVEVWKKQINTDKRWTTWNDTRETPIM